MTECAICGHPLMDHATDGCWNKDAPPMEFYCECEMFEEKENVWDNRITAKEAADRIYRFAMAFPRILKEEA